VIVALLSEDYKLFDLCGAILAEQGLESRPLLVAAGPEAPLPHADLYIWDFLPDFGVARCLATCDPHRHILLVDRSSLAAHSGSAFHGLKLVVKPVTRVALAAWLLPAVESLAESGKPPADGQDRMISALAEANIRLQEYELDRSSYLAKVTHDFRVPLTAMNGYCGLLLAGALGPLTDIQREVLSRTQNSLKRLTRMSSAMLQLSSEAATGKALSLEECDLHECIEQAIHEVQPLIGEKRIRVTSNLRPSSKTLFFDVGQLERVFTNLFENACKFTTAGGHIEIRGYPYFWERRSTRVRGLAVPERRSEMVAEPNAFRVDVCNTGPCINPEHLSRMFDEYTSYGEGSNGAGTGLGLAICKSIVQDHRGRIWAENHAGGPALSFVLPLEYQTHTNVMASNGNKRSEMKGAEC
jgi:signal transduction histidine kinase